MQTETLILKNPIKMTVRDGDVRKETTIDKVVFMRRSAGDFEPNRQLTTNCARNFTREDGRGVTYAELSVLYVEQGMRSAAAAAFDTSRVI